MLQALTGFVVVGAAILLGYILGRTNLLGEHARPVLSRLTFFALSPVLLFVVLANADVHNLFSALLPVSAIAAVSVMLVHTLIARLGWRRSVGETLVGALSAGQVNSNNIGIPLSLYLLGSAAYPAPVILFQLVVLTPITMAIFESIRGGKSSVGRILFRTFTNPMVIGSVLGVIVSVSGVTLPSIVMDPLEFIGAACVPILLISFGISLHGQRVLAASGRRGDVILATSLKLLAMPLIAWVLGQFVFALPPHDVLIVVTLAALPTAQNVFNYSQRFGVGEIISRDVVLLTTLGCIPILIASVLILG